LSTTRIDAAAAGRQHDQPAVPSTTVGITANLDSNTAIGGTATSSSLDIYDSLGTSHTLTVNYTMTAVGT